MLNWTVFKSRPIKNMYEVFSVVLNLDYGKGRQRNVESNLSPVVLKLFNKLLFLAEEPPSKAVANSLVLSLWQGLFY